MSMSCDTRRCVVVLGTGSLQRYIFQSNRLKENLGASFLAKHCFDHGLIDAIKKIGAPLDTEAWKSYENPECRPQSALEMPENIGIHIIYVGGGNAALLCKNGRLPTRWSRNGAAN